MKKLLLIVPAFLLMQGCYAYAPAKIMADAVCSSSSAKQAVLSEEIDAYTTPHIIRVQCYANPKK
jgi:hypothetical protein